MRKIIFEKKIIFTAGAYFFIYIVLLYMYGVELGGEAVKYIDNANRILHHQELRNGVFGIFYFSYSVIVAFFVYFSINLVYVGVLQVMVSFIAALCVYQLLKDLLQQQQVAFLFFLAYLLCYPIQKWNFFLYSESIHTSFIVFGLYFFFKMLQSKKLSRAIVFGISLVAILFSRPVGIIFLMPVGVVAICWLYNNSKKKIAYLFAGILLLIVIAVANSPLTTFINADSIRRMEIICQVPETSQVAGYQEFNKAGLYKAFLVIKNEIGVGNFFVNGFKKLGRFFGMQRPYYKWHTNAFLMLYWIVYPFMLVGVLYKQHKSFYYLKLFSLTYLLCTAAVIFFTCDDWASRFISPVFPFILILAAAGCSTVFKKIFPVRGVIKDDFL